MQKQISEYIETSIYLPTYVDIEKGTVHKRP